jgi:hypothetical protein
MPTPTERLEERKRILECRVCAWLETLPDKDRAEWQKAIINPRFGASLVATVIMDERASAIADRRDNEGVYDVPGIGESSVLTHRARGHR